MYIILLRLAVPRRLKALTNLKREENSVMKIEIIMLLYEVNEESTWNITLIRPFYSTSACFWSSFTSLRLKGNPSNPYVCVSVSLADGGPLSLSGYLLPIQASFSEQTAEFDRFIAYVFIYNGIFISLNTNHVTKNFSKVVFLLNPLCYQYERFCLAKISHFLYQYIE